jgi:hypothetical protein
VTVGSSQAPCRRPKTSAWNRSAGHIQMGEVTCRVWFNLETLPVRSKRGTDLRFEVLPIGNRNRQFFPDSRGVCDMEVAILVVVFIVALILVYMTH